MAIRKKYTEIINHIPKKEFTILIGARQIGKSTLLKQLAEDLTQKGESVFFINLERKSVLLELDQDPENLFKFCPLAEGKRIIVMIDEIQYLKDASGFLKLIYDEYAVRVKIVATGSSAFYIDRNFKDSLAGRKRIFQMPSLDFDEFLDFKGKPELLADLISLQKREKQKSVYENLFWALMDEYLNYGGYPAVVLENDFGGKKELLKEIRDSYIKRDILESAVNEEEKFYRLLMILASQSGNLLNVNELSNTLRINNSTIENYLYILQKCFHISLVRPFYSNIRKELVKMPKVYFNDLGLRNILINYFAPIEQRADKGVLLENYVFRKLLEKQEPDQIKFWRTANGNEVDFVVETSFQKGYAVEVKFQDNEGKLSKYKIFTKAYPDFPLQIWHWGNRNLLV
ncbi:MAG: putative ATPase [Prolixibacteraceae bacterium]|nr:MAG: putative ATPase [Prolixibacteraceae bacterium]